MRARSCRAKITAPIIGASDAPVDLVIKLLVKRAGGQISADVQICSLVSDSPSLKIDYAKMLPFMKQTVGAPDFEAIAGSKVEIVDIRTDETDQVKAKSNVKDVILNTPDVACLLGLWSYNGPAIVNAVKEADKVGKIQIVCFDEEDVTLQGVRDGAIFATVVQQPFEFGYQAIKLMHKVLKGDDSAIPASKQIIVPTLAIQKDNVDDFATKLKQLRGK